MDLLYHLMALLWRPMSARTLPTLSHMSPSPGSSLAAFLYDLSAALWRPISCRTIPLSLWAPAMSGSALIAASNARRASSLRSRAWSEWAR